MLQEVNWFARIASACNMDDGGRKKREIEVWLKANPQPSRGEHDPECAQDIAGFVLWCWMWNCVQTCPVWLKNTAVARAHIRTFQCVPREGGGWDSVEVK